MKKLTDFVVFGNLFIAAGAGCFVWETYILLGLDINYFYILIGFAATLFIYNTDRLVVLNSLDEKGSERHRWIVSNAKIMTAISVLSVVFLGVSILYLPLRSIIFLAHLGFISIAYSIPILSKGKKTLRSIRFIKIFLITYVWASSTVILPALGAGMGIFQKDIILLFVERSLFIFAITLPFDIRDYKSDINNKVLTIPGIIGIGGARALALACIIVFFIINLIHYQLHSGILLAKLISGGSTMIFIFFAGEERPEYYFTALLDGTIIIQFVLVMLLHQNHFF